MTPAPCHSRSVGGSGKPASGSNIRGSDGTPHPRISTTAGEMRFTRGARLVVENVSPCSLYESLAEQAPNPRTSARLQTETPIHLRHRQKVLRMEHASGDPG